MRSSASCGTRPTISLPNTSTPSASAARLGVAVLASEVVGLVPQAALDRAAAHFLRLENYSPDLVLENRIAAALERKGKHF